MKTPIYKPLGTLYNVLRKEGGRFMFLAYLQRFIGGVVQILSMVLFLLSLQGSPVWLVLFFTTFIIGGYMRYLSRQTVRFRG
jgi:hypothetical protein